MPLKVTWKKGMRLSTEVFDASDSYNDENIRLCNLITTGGRFGLIRGDKPFELSINVGNNIVEVVSLSCHGVTNRGRIVDVDFDSGYTGTFDTRLSIPASADGEAYLLTVRYHDGAWREVNEMYSEPAYTFELVPENSPIGPDSLPIGLLVNQYGWRLDETEFVPPCLYTNAHPKYIDQVNRAMLVFKYISDRCLGAVNCVARRLLAQVWQSATDNYNYIDKKQEGLCPADLFASVQRVVTAFMIGCSVDEYITLDNPDPFVAYCQKPYDARHLYRDIQQGLELCSEISLKMESVCAMTEMREPTPTPVEKPKPKPQPAPEPKPAGRNRWDGIEI